MEKTTSINDVLRAEKNSIYFYSARVAAWENVKRVCRKNGEDFKILSKNFENCSFTKKLYGSGFELTVFFEVEHIADDGSIRRTYDHDYISISGDETPDDIVTMIEGEVNKYNYWITLHEKNIENINYILFDYIITLKAAYAEAVKRIDKITPEGGPMSFKHNPIKYALENLAENIKYLD